jgi:hypothetical protein
MEIINGIYYLNQAKTINGQPLTLAMLPGSLKMDSILNLLKDIRLKNMFLSESRPKSQSS